MISRPMVKGVKGLVKGLVKGSRPKILCESGMVKGVKGSPQKTPCVRACVRTSGRAGARVRTCAHAVPQPFTPFIPLTIGDNAMRERRKIGEGFGEGCEGSGERQ